MAKNRSTKSSKKTIKKLTPKNSSTKSSPISNPSDSILQTQIKESKQPEKSPQSQNPDLKMPIDNQDIIKTTDSNDLSNESLKPTQIKDSPAFPKKEDSKSESGLGQILSIIWGVALVGAFLGFNFYVIPQVILEQTDDAKAIRSSEENQKRLTQIKKDAEAKLATENQKLNFQVNKDWKVKMTFADYGDLNIVMNNDWAPKTVENFIRLSYRKYYDNTIIHRIVEEEGFEVIQGGDADKGDGTGGKSAFYIDPTETGLIPDELWSIKPEFSSDPQDPKLTNQPVFRNPDFYINFDSTIGNVTYPKGLILMAKTSQPDSASSQFFITLSDTTLPAQYTAFGKIEPQDFPVLDKIKKEIDPIVQEPVEGQPALKDGKPNKDLSIVSTTIVSPVI
jgi:cyclophilin family peptidyl-prolyl cis-trans isomerase